MASTGFALLVLRIWAILRAQVVWREAVGPWWWVVAAALAIPMAAASGGPLPVLGDGPVFDAVLSELVFGTLLGVLVALPGYALLGAAAVATQVTGLNQIRARTLNHFVVLVVVASALGLGLHRPLLIALADLAFAFPPGDPLAWTVIASDGAALAAGAMHAAVVLGLALATPVLLTTAVIELAGGLLAAGPDPAGAWARPLTAFGRCAAALIALGAALTAYPEAWARALG